MADLQQEVEREEAGALPIEPERPFVMVEFIDGKLATYPLVLTADEERTLYIGVGCICIRHWDRLQTVRHQTRTLHIPITSIRTWEHYE